MDWEIASFSRLLRLLHRETRRVYLFQVDGHSEISHVYLFYVDGHSEISRGRGFHVDGHSEISRVYLFHVGGHSEMSRGRGEDVYVLGRDKKRAGKKVGCDSPPC